MCYEDTHFCYSKDDPLFIVNYLVNNFSEDIDVLKLKFKQIVFELFNVVKNSQAEVT